MSNTVLIFGKQDDAERIILIGPSQKQNTTCNVVTKNKTKKKNMKLGRRPYLKFGN